MGRAKGTDAADSFAGIMGERRGHKTDEEFEAKTVYYVFTDCSLDDMLAEDSRRAVEKVLYALLDNAHPLVKWQETTNKQARLAVTLRAPCDKDLAIVRLQLQKAAGNTCAFSELPG